MEHGTPGTLPALDGLDAAYAGPDVSVYRVPGAAPAPAVRAGRVVAVAVGNAVAVLALLATGLAAVTRKRRDQRPQ